MHIGWISRSVIVAALGLSVSCAQHTTPCPATGDAGSTTGTDAGDAGSTTGTDAGQPDSGTPQGPKVPVFAASATALGVAGGATTLLWATDGATSVSIDNGVGDVATSGFKDVQVTANTTFTLTATGPGGMMTATVMVTLTPPDLYVDPVNGADSNPGTQERPFKTLKQAYAAAVTGQTINLAAGTYSSDSGEDFNEKVPDGVSLAGTEGAQTILQSTGSGVALDFAGSGGASNLTIQGFSLAVNAIGGTVALKAVALTDNATAVHLEQTAAMTATDVTITSSVPNASGYELSERASLTTSGGSISGFTPACGSGDGIYAQDTATVSVTGTNMSHMGATAIEARDDATVTVANATFDTTADVGCGGEDAIDVSGISKVTLTGVTITGVNTALLARGRDATIKISMSSFSNDGIAIRSGGSALNVDSSSFTGGVGILCDAGCYLTLTGSTFTNCTTAVTLGDGSQTHMSKTSITGTGSGSSTGIYQYGSSGYLDLGTASSPGGNIFLGSQNELEAPEMTASSSVIQAVGNIWNSSVQGASSRGTYATQLVTGPASGRNFSIGTGARIQF